MVETFMSGDSYEWKIDSRYGVKDLYKLLPNTRVRAFIRSIGSMETFEATNTAVEKGYIGVFIDSVLSEKLPPGKATLLLRFENGEGFRKTLIACNFEILPKAEDLNFDPRTNAQKCLDQARAALSKYTASGGRVKRYTIGSRSLEYSSASELQKLVDYWLWEVHLEECRRAGRDPRKVLVEFI